MAVNASAFARAGMCMCVDATVGDQRGNKRRANRPKAGSAFPWLAFRGQWESRQSMMRRLSIPERVRDDATPGGPRLTWRSTPVKRFVAAALPVNVVATVYLAPAVTRLPTRRRLKFQHQHQASGGKLYLARISWRVPAPGGTSVSWPPIRSANSAR